MPKIKNLILEIVFIGKFLSCSAKNSILYFVFNLLSIKYVI